MVLITNKNNPNVIIVMGNVRNIIIGLIKTFKSPKTIATINAAFKSVTVIPGSILESTNTATAVNINFIIVFIVVFKPNIAKTMPF